MSFEDDFAYLQLNSNSFSIEVNEHRAYYRTAEQFIDDEHEDNRRHFGDIERVKCIESDTIVMVQVYPVTPIGSFTVASYAASEAVRQAAVALREYHEKNPR